MAAREENRYHTLDEREVASSLQDWLKERHSLLEETAAEVADKLAEIWRTGVVKVDQAPPIVLEPAPELESEVPENSSDSREESGPPAAKIPPSTWWSSSPERYSDCTDRGLKGVGWGGGGSFEIVKNTLASPIRPSAPTFVVYVGRAGEKGKTQLARPPQPFREMGRR